MTRTRSILALAAVASLGLLTACGDDSGSKAADTTAAAAEGSDTTAASGSGDTAPADTSTDVTSGGDAPGVGTEFCNYQEELNSMDTPFEADNPTADDFKTFFEQTVTDAVAQMRSTAPAEIADDVEVLAKGLERLSAAFERAGWDPATALNDADVIALQGEQSYSDAGTAVDAYCGNGA